MIKWPLIAMENTLFANRSLGWAERCATIAEAGFDGVYAVPYPLEDEDFTRLRQLQREPARHGLRLAGIYANIDLAQTPAAVSNFRVERLFRETEGGQRIELSFKCSDARARPMDIGDAVRSRLEPLLNIADRAGTEVALYPHSFYPVESIADAARIVKKIGHRNLSYLFATSHVYAVHEPIELVRQLATCASEISSFNLCGCRRISPGPHSKCAHFPLDEGNLPLSPLFAALAEGGYTGDVIVQGHGWQDDLLGKLRRCVASYAQEIQRLVPSYPYSQRGF